MKRIFTVFASISFLINVDASAFAQTAKNKEIISYEFKTPAPQYYDQAWDNYAKTLPNRFTYAKKYYFDQRDEIALLSYLTISNRNNLDQWYPIWDDFLYYYSCNDVQKLYKIQSDEFNGVKASRDFMDSTSKLKFDAFWKGKPVEKNFEVTADLQLGVYDQSTHSFTIENNVKTYDNVSVYNNTYITNSQHNTTLSLQAYSRLRTH